MVSMTIQEIVLKPFHRRGQSVSDQQRHRPSRRHSLDSMSNSGIDPQRHQPRRRNSSDSMSESGFHPQQHGPSRRNLSDSMRESGFHPEQHRPSRRRHSSDSMSRSGFDSPLQPPNRRHSSDSPSPRNNSDNEARRKAAAWARYEHGGSSVVPTTRFVGGKVGTKDRISQLPMSRFKTEAMRESNNNPSVSSVWDCGSTLYDAFELSSFSEQLAHILQGGPTSRDSSSHRLPRHLRQTAVGRAVSDLSVPRYCSSTTPNNNTQNHSVDDVVERNRRDQCGGHRSGHAAVCEEKLKKTGLRRSFFFLNKVFQRMLKRRSVPEEKDDREEDHRHYHHHHHHHHHYHQQIPASAAEGNVLPSKKLGSIFARSTFQR